jgi:hypothetical protein
MFGTVSSLIQEWLLMVCHRELWLWMWHGMDGLVFLRWWWVVMAGLNPDDFGWTRWFITLCYSHDVPFVWIGIGRPLWPDKV